MDLIKVILLFVLIMALGSWNIYRSNRRKQLQEQLKRVLRQEGYERFSAMLDTQQARRYFTAYAAGQEKLEAAISWGRHDEARRLIEQLNRTPMPSKQFINYNMMVLGYAVERKDQAMAKTACDALHRRGIAKSYGKEADQVYDIYILRKSNHIEEIRAFAAKVKNPASRAMAYYRIARQCYYIKDMESCQEYLRMSREVYQNETWQGIIQKILDGDYSQLEK